MVPTKIKRYLMFLGLNVFTNISKPVMDLWLKNDTLTMFCLLAMMHGLDHDLGAHKDQEIGKNGFPKAPLFCTMADQRLAVFCHLLMIHDELCRQI